MREFPQAVLTDPTCARLVFERLSFSFGTTPFQSLVFFLEKNNQDWRWEHSPFRPQCVVFPNKQTHKILGVETHTHRVWVKSRPGLVATIQGLNGGQRLNGQSRARTQRVVHRFSGNSEDEKYGLWTFQYSVAMCGYLSSKTDPNILPKHTHC